MQTIITYKIAWIDQYGVMNEMDFPTKQLAIDYAAQYNITDYKLFEVRIVGQIKQL